MRFEKLLPDGLPIGAAPRPLSATSTERPWQCLVPATNQNSDRMRRLLLPYGRIGVLPRTSPMFLAGALPGLETIVIPLPDDLAFPELQKHCKKGLHLPPPLE